MKRNLSRALTALRLTAADGATGGSGTSDCKSTWGASYFKVTCELCSGVQCCKCTINSWDFPNPPPCSCYED